MKHFLASIIVCLLITTAAFSQESTNSLFIDITAGFGISSSSHDNMIAADFGNDYFGDSTLFSDNSAFEIEYLKRYVISIDYFVLDSIAFRLGLGYSNRPFTFTYIKDTAPTDYVFHANYEMLEYTIGLKILIWKYLYTGIGISFNHLINKTAYESYNGNVIESPLSLAEDNSSIYFDIGTCFQRKGNKFYIFTKMQGDATKVFPYHYDIGSLSLIDLSLNIGISIPF